MGQNEKTYHVFDRLPEKWGQASYTSGSNILDRPKCLVCNASDGGTARVKIASQKLSIVFLWLMSSAIRHFDSIDSLAYCFK
jgi:hypothetical protein